MMSLTVITARVPEEIAKKIKSIATIEALDRSTVIKRLLVKAVQEWSLDYGIKRYQEGKISIGKVAEMAEVSIWEIIDELAKRRVPLQVDREELLKDLESAGSGKW